MTQTLLVSLALIMTPPHSPSSSGAARREKGHSNGKLANIERSIELYIWPHVFLNPESISSWPRIIAYDLSLVHASKLVLSRSEGNDVELDQPQYAFTSQPPSGALSTMVHTVADRLGNNALPGWKLDKSRRERSWRMYRNR
jgi:hypothetical protein